MYSSACTSAWQFLQSRMHFCSSRLMWLSLRVRFLEIVNSLVPLVWWKSRAARQLSYAQRVHLPPRKSTQMRLKSFRRWRVLCRSQFVQLLSGRSRPFRRMNSAIGKSSLHVEHAFLPSVRLSSNFWLLCVRNGEHVKQYLRTQSLRFLPSMIAADGMRCSHLRHSRTFSRVDTCRYCHDPGLTATGRLMAI